VAIKSYAPQQERSRQTLDSLLVATVEVLDQHGLEGATIPRIAKAAKVAPASVYRRFEDKDALIRASLLSVLEQSSQATSAALDPARFVDRSIEDSARSLIKTIFLQYRQHPKLINALKRFSEQPGEKEFEQKATDAFAENFRRMVRALASCKDLGRMRNKGARIQFALMTVSTAIEIMVLEPTSLWNVLLTESDEQIQANLVKMLLAYLAV
jgi:AcrR family transcriptional regulator